MSPGLPSPRFLALLLAGVVLLSPTGGGALEAKGAVLVGVAGLLAAWALWRGVPGLGPGTPASLLAWGLAGAHALSAAVRGAPEGAAFRVAAVAALAVALAWASRIPAGRERPLLAVLAGLGAWTGLGVLALRAGLPVPFAASFDHKGMAAAFLSIALPSAMLLAVQARGAWRLPALVALAAVASGLLLGETRAAWLAGLAGGAAILPFLSGRRRLGALLLGLAVLGAAAGLAHPSRVPQRLWARFTSIVRNRDPRLAFWEVSWDVWGQRPLLGHGPGAFEDAVALPAARALGEARMDSFSRFAHNDLLQTGVETGWLGALLLLALGGALARAVLRGLRQADTALRLRHAAAGAGLLADTVNLVLAFPLHEPGCALALALLAGLAAGAAPAAPSAPPRRVLAAGVLVALALSLRLPAALAAASAGAHAAAARLAPATPEVLFRHAEAALPDGAACARRLGPARRRVPQSGEVWTRLGKAALFRHDPGKALAAFRRASLLAPWSADARVGLAYACAQAGDWPAAYAVLDHCALKAFPCEFTGFFYQLRGRLMLQEGRDLPGALYYLRQALFEQANYGRFDAFPEQDFLDALAAVERRLRARACPPPGTGL